jgi:hypothetical protein
MRASRTTVTVLAGVTILSFALAFANGSVGDYPRDAGPTMDALLRGDLGGAFASHPIMGAFSLLVRLPFAAFASALGGDQLAIYRFGCIPCLLALGLVGLAIAREMARRGVAAPACVASAALCIANPLTWEALRLGHPEELLGTALVVAAVLAALRANALAAGVALGLALATKQWAVIAVLPVLAAAPRQRLRLGLVAAALALALTVPVLATNSGGFYTANRQAGWSGERVYPFNALWPVAPTEDRIISVGGERSVVTVRTVPTAVAQTLHPLIVVLALPLTGIWLLRRRRFEAEDVFMLLALAFLLRCLLDPVDNVYYHLPFATSLLAWEGLRRRTMPMFAALTALGVWFAIRKATMFSELEIRNALYLAATMPFAVWLTSRLVGGGRRDGTVARSSLGRVLARAAVAGR